MQRGTVVVPTARRDPCTRSEATSLSSVDSRSEATSLSSVDSGDTPLSSVDSVNIGLVDTFSGNYGAGGDDGAARGADGTRFEENSNIGAGDFGSRLLSHEQEESNIDAGRACLGGPSLRICEEELAD